MRLWRLCLGTCLIAGLASGASVSGTVEDPVGAAVSVVSVELRGTVVQRAQTDELGRFRLDGVEAGTYKLWLRHPGLRTKVLRLEVSALQQEMDLGRVPLGIDAFGFIQYEPVELESTGAAIWVSFSVEGKAAVSWTLSCKTSESCGTDSFRGKGAANLRNLRSGTYRLSADAKGHYPGVDEFELIDGIGYSFGFYLGKCSDRRCDPADRGIMLE